MINWNAIPAIRKAIALAAAIFGPFVAGLWFASLAAAQAAPERECFRDNMRAADVRACAAMANTPGINARERSEIFAARATAWLKEEEPAAAVADFTRAIELDPANLAAISGRASAHTLLLKHDLAAADWSHVIALNPAQPDSYRQRGASYLSGGRPQEALEDFNKAIQLKPGVPDIYVERAGVYEQLQDREMALKEFDLAIAAEPGQWTTYLARAELADRWGDVKMAIENYRLVVKYNHRYWNAYKALHRLGASHAFDD